MTSSGQGGVPSSGFVGDGRLLHCVHRPAPPLDALVECLWFERSEIVLGRREAVLPSGSPALVVNLGDEGISWFGALGSSAPNDLPNATVLGARTSALVFRGAPRSAVIGVQFKPGGARPFLGVAMGELEDLAVSLDVLWGSSGRSLRERLLELPSVTARFRLLEAVLLERLRGDAGRSAALRVALDAFEDADVGSVAAVNDRTGLSPKRLLSLFRDEVGLAPKAFWRVRRFRAALRGLQSGAARGAALAADCGYFDQAHLDREFRRLAGLTPREYLARRDPVRPDHVALRG